MLPVLGLLSASAMVVTGSRLDTYDWSRFPAAWFGANATHWESPEQIAEIGRYALAILGWQHLAGEDNMTAVTTNGTHEHRHTLAPEARSHTRDPQIPHVTRR